MGERHDLVVRTVHDQDGDGELAELRLVLVAVAQQQAHGQPRVVLRPRVPHRRESALDDQPRRRPMARELDRDPDPEGFAEEE